MWVGISAVGCLRTDDGGQSWVFANKNTRASFQPDTYPEFGQCIHRFVQHPTQPDILYQQNHCGIYKSTNAGEDWIDIQRDLPSEFGFPIALDTQHPDTVYTIVEAEGRHNVGTQFTVYRTIDGGDSLGTPHEWLACRRAGQAGRVTAWDVYRQPQSWRRLRGHQHRSAFWQPRWRPRWVLAGTDYVYPRTTNQILEAYLKVKGVKRKIS